MVHNILSLHTSQVQLLVTYVAGGEEISDTWRFYLICGVREPDCRQH